ncbi:MAG: KpsF/GutQ family sugar-phosphate isomerase [Rubripirellula sp.]|nr:KpsF/GutQ family sugar-phosphate isomerase [Rubripirellula sp.]
MNSVDIVKRVIEAERDALSQLRAAVPAQTNDVLDAIGKLKGRVILVGLGKSGIAGKKIAATFNSTGVPAIYLHPIEAMHGDLGIVSGEDIAICISNSGETDELLTLIPHFERLGILTISITSQADSTLAKISQVAIIMPRLQEADGWNLIPTCSTIAVLSFCDALAIAHLERRGLTADQFAEFHPGGSLGRKSFLRAQDLMLSGDAMPIVDNAMPLIKAIGTMSKGGLGCLLVSSDTESELGVFTDGDLRRLIEANREIANTTVGDVASLDPKSIESHQLASKALHLMEEHRIMVLVVTENDKLAGILHMHDLLRAGLA